MGEDEAGRFRIRRTGVAQRALHGFRSRCTFRSIMNSLSNFFPILDWLPKYNWQNSFFGDLSGGLTMAVFAVPQGKNFSQKSKSNSRINAAAQDFFF